MRIKISYLERKEKIIELTPEQYCNLHNGKDKNKYLPQNIIEWDYEFADENAENELLEYFYK